MKLKFLFFIVQSLCCVTVFCDGSTDFESKNVRSSRVKRSSIITEKLMQAYEKYENIKRYGSEFLQDVDEAFQRLNITMLHQLPNTKIKTVELFQKLPFNPVTPTLVEKAFNLKPASFIHPTIVGYGYDILKDTVIGNSPFILDNLKLARIGYYLPDIYNCSIKEKEELVEDFEFIESYEEFIQKRLKKLNIPPDSVNSSVFTGAVRSSFNNVKPDSDAFITLTAIQQLRNFELNLVLQSTLDDIFMSEVDELTPFNENDRKSEREWKAFFGKYGTHVVTKAFGGGYMEGKASGDAIEKNLLQRNVLQNVKKTLISFENLPENINSGELQMSHTFFGGAPDAEMANILNLRKEKKEKLYDEWKKSVKLDPRIMDTDIELIPISEIVGSVDKAKGQEIKNSLDRFLLGNLSYIRKKNNKNQSNEPIQNAFNANSDISKDLQAAYESLDENMKRSHPAILLQLVQGAFHRENITTRDELPKTMLETVKLFQTLPLNSVTLALVEKAFNLKQPLFIHPTIVGYGYDILKDSMVKKSPYKLEKLQETPMGYLLPDIYSVTKNDKEILAQNFEIVESYKDYKLKRLADLTTYSEIVNSDVFTPVTMRSTYNIFNLKTINPLQTLTAIKQTQYFKLNLNLKSPLDEEFIADLNKLTPCTPSERESLKEWKQFFGKYGTHVVTEAFGGGYMEAKATGDEINDNSKNDVILNGIKETMISFDNLPINLNYWDLQINHTFFGGDPNSTIGNVALNKLPYKDKREKLIQKWKSTVQFDPIIMDIDIKLVPISEIVTFNDSVAQEIRNSLSLLFEGNLVYSRRRSNSTPRPQIFTLKAKNRTEKNQNTVCMIPNFNPVHATHEKNCAALESVDRTGNIIAQGYYALQDSILPKSPFRIRIETLDGNSLPVGVSVITGKDKPCSYYFFKEMPTYANYAKQKLQHLIDKLHPEIKQNITVNVTSFQGSIKPGYNLEDETPFNGPFSIYKEIRYAYVNADFKRLTLADDFISAVNRLKSYNDNKANCKVHEEWLDFFQEYGTHVVKAGYLGTWRETIAVGDTVDEINSFYEAVNNKCPTIIKSSVDRSIKPGVLTSSLTYSTLKQALEKFSHQFEPNNTFLVEYDDVMKALFENRLIRCNR